MEISIDDLHSSKVGLALGGGGPRGIAHIGVLRVLIEAGIKPSFVAGTSVGSLIGAAIAAGQSTDQLTEMARNIFWPSLLNARRIERFCRKFLPERIEDLQIPYAAVAIEVPSFRQVNITSGNLISAISASCAVPIVRLPVKRDELQLWDGGLICVLPAVVCRELGADHVISSDVWEFGEILRKLKRLPQTRDTKPRFIANYRQAVEETDLMITSSIPLSCFIPVQASVHRMLEAGAAAAKKALDSFWGRTRPAC